MAGNINTNTLAQGGPVLLACFRDASHIVQYHTILVVFIKESRQLIVCYLDLEFNHCLLFLVLKKVFVCSFFN